MTFLDENGDARGGKSPRRAPPGLEERTMPATPSMQTTPTMLSTLITTDDAQNIEAERMARENAIQAYLKRCESTMPQAADQRHEAPAEQQQQMAMLEKAVLKLTAEVEAEREAN